MGTLADDNDEESMATPHKLSHYFCKFQKMYLFY
jgi:hypothetical protein